jgi:hypothetical protein
LAKLHYSATLLAAHAAKNPYDRGFPPILWSKIEKIELTCLPRGESKAIVASVLKNTTRKSEEVPMEKLSLVDQIGETAGEVWTLLNENGPLSLAKTVKAIGKPRDLVMQALGWLAREGKIEILEEGRSRVVTLR